MSLHQGDRPALPLDRPTGFRIPGLDGIRAIAVLMVLLAHSDITREYTGGTGVSIFFFLSGYLITTLLLREQAATATISVRSFYIRRFFRIVPPLYLLIAAGCLASATGLTGGLLSVRGITSAAFFGGNYFMLYPHHNWPDGFGILWSLAVEEHFYLIFPVLFLAMQRWSRRSQIALLGTLCALALGWRFAFLALWHLSSHIYLATDARFDAILFGCILAFLLARSPISHVHAPTSPSRGSRLYGRFATLLALMGVAGTLLWEHVPHIKGALGSTLTGLTLMPVFAWVVANPHHRVVCWLESRVLVRIGVLSYSIYLFHMLCMSIFARHTHLGHPLCMLCGLPLCYLIALAIERFIDRPAHRLRTRVLANAATSRRREPRTESAYSPAA